MTFESDTIAVRSVRRALAPLLNGDARIARDVVLAASEIVTNVVQHTEDGGRFEAWIDDDYIVLRVHDDGAGFPTASEHQSERGERGLAIVAKIAEAWGVEPTSPGKVVWARFSQQVAP